MTRATCCFKPLFMLPPLIIVATQRFRTFDLIPVGHSPLSLSLLPLLVPHGLSNRTNPQLDSFKLHQPGADKSGSGSASSSNNLAAEPCL